MKGIWGFTVLFAGDFAPVNWALCDGSLLLVSRHPALFSIIGNTYGGDGIKTFALPDLRGRAIVGAGQGSSWYNIGEVGGSETAQLAYEMFPVHTHPLIVTITPRAAITTNSSSPENAVYATGSNTLYSYVNPDSYMAAYNATVISSKAGGNNYKVPVPILHPLLALNYIICVESAFPLRDEQEKNSSWQYA